MVLLALAYGGLMSGLMLYVGRPLVSCFARKNEAEGIFRFALMRLRENAESVALLRGADSEKQTFKLGLRHRRARAGSPSCASTAASPGSPIPAAR